MTSNADDYGKGLSEQSLINGSSGERYCLKNNIH